MSVFDFWHPLIRSKDLPRDRPVAVQLGGRELALFRSENNQVAALEDLCPHRRMRLSAGKIQSGRLTCAYHGWTFAPTGAGESPGTPKLHACAESFDCQDVHG